jgi:NAD(P)-dependent dehydrogenase (short-subunit alcohol dehydrogenase family)
MAPSEIAADEGVLIIAVSSDIGERLALDYLRRGFRVAGTYRSEAPASLRDHPNFLGLKCDVTQPESGPALSSYLVRVKFRWRVLISCVGQLAPIGPFFENDFESWARSVDLNGVAQLRALHVARPLRGSGLCHVVFFAGGGTNGPFRNYSAYCVGKIALIKMCELLDDENPDLNVFIVGTGWVHTKIHDQTIAAGIKAGSNFETTKVFIADDNPGTSHSDIAAMINWGITQGKAVASGRNFSVVHDGWRNGGDSLAGRLRSDPAKFKLRRKGNEEST